MASPRTLSQLSTVIQSRISVIDDAYKAEGRAPPSLALGAPLNPEAPSEALEAQVDLIEALDELKASLCSPVQALQNRLLDLVRDSATFNVICQMGVAQRLALDETITFAELGSRCGVPVDDLRRYMRAAISMRIFEEPQQDMVRHNACSAALVSMPELFAWTRMCTEILAPASFHTAEALRRWPPADQGKAQQDPALTPYACMTGQSFFPHMQTDPDLLQMMRDCMTMHSQTSNCSVSLAAKALGWSAPAPAPTAVPRTCGTGWCPKTLVDVGGNTGLFASELLRQYPDIESAVVQDLPEVIRGVQSSPPAEDSATHDTPPPSDDDDVDADAHTDKKMKETVSKAAGSRLGFECYDFHTEQPLRGADAYVFRSVLHDWPDDVAAQILRNQVPALEAGRSRIVICDVVLPGFRAADEKPSYVQDSYVRGYDLSMKTNFNGKERTLEDWAALVAAADSRLEIASIKTPPGGAQSVMEIVLKG